MPAGFKFFFAFVLALVLADAPATAESPAQQSAQQKSVRLASRSRPVRIDGPLRYENISDIEVREIETATRKVYPGAIVNISGVTTGCPCEDGPTCTDQVWIVAYRPERIKGLMLSRIDGRWGIG